MDSIEMVAVMKRAAQQISYDEQGQLVGQAKFRLYEGASHIECLFKEHQIQLARVAELERQLSECKQHCATFAVVAKDAQGACVGYWSNETKT